MCQHSAREPFHPNRMRSDKMRHSPSQGLKRSSANQASKPVPTGRKAKLTRSDKQNNNVENGQSAGFFAANVKNDRLNHSKEQSAQKPKKGHRNLGSPKQCDQVTGSPRGAKVVTPSKPMPLCISPSKMVSTSAFAGAKFSDPPSPKVLPKPPVHWMNKENEPSGGSANSSCLQMTNVLKVMLNVQA